MSNEHEAMARDALRYRTLRASLSGDGEPPITTTFMPVISVPMTEGRQSYFRSGLDAAIDKAAAVIANASKCSAPMIPTKEPAYERWICLQCKSSRRGVHGMLDDGVTPCPGGAPRAVDFRKTRGEVPR